MIDASLSRFSFGSSEDSTSVVPGGLRELASDAKDPAKRASSGSSGGGSR